MNTSQFGNNNTVSQLLNNATIVSHNGATCDTFMAKMHGKRILIKRLKEKHRYNPKYRLALQKEFEAGFMLEHRALPRYLMFNEDSIVMDFIDGITLKQFISEKPTYFNKKNNVNKFIQQLFDCLSYLHSNSIIHLDLKPENIIITRIGYDVKVIDLGFCYTDTYHNTIGHNNAFSAPEQLTENPDIDIRADIYSAGKILEYILSGSHLTSKYDSIIKKATHEDRCLRFQTIDEFKNTALFTNKSKYRKILLLTLVSTLLGGILSYIVFNNKSNSITSNQNTNNLIVNNSYTPYSAPIKYDTLDSTNFQNNNNHSNSLELKNDNSDKHIISNNDTQINTVSPSLSNTSSQLIDISDFEKFIKKQAPHAYQPLYDSFHDSINKSSQLGEVMVKCSNIMDRMAYNFLKNKPEQYKRCAFDSLKNYEYRYGYKPVVIKLQNEGFLKDHPSLIEN